MHEFRNIVAWFILLLTVSVSEKLFAQDDFFKNRLVTAQYHYGYIWAHKPRVEHLTTGHTQGIELSLVRQTTGEKLWQQIHGYPQTGVSLMYFDLANPEVVGNASAIIGFINFPILRNENFQFSLQSGAGLGYLSKRFDPDTDHKNMGIGSHINSTIRFMFQGRYRVSKHLFLHLHYGVTHFSNAAFHLPNLGVNNISLAGGISYQPSSTDEFQVHEKPKPDKRWILETVYGTGVKENFPPDGKQFFAHTFYVQALKPLGHTSRIAAGVDVCYDLSLFRFVKDAKSDSDKQLKVLRSGIHIGYEMQVNRFTLLTHMGYYVLDQTKIDSAFYHRYGLKYQLLKNLFINLSLKTHWARADYAELGIGWRGRL